MSGSFFRDLGISKPQIHLGISGGSHGSMTGEMLAGIETQFRRVKPSMVVVLGDTNSTLAAALAAAKLNIRVAHVEAGLRSFDRRMPEEVNRRITDHISTLLFCPSPLAARNLRVEGIRQGVEVVGDVMCDVLRRMRPAAGKALDAMMLPDAYYSLTMSPERNWGPLAWTLYPSPQGWQEPRGQHLGRVAGA